MGTEQLVILGLIAVAGLLIGGVYTTWKTAKMMALLLFAGALLAGGGAVVWWLSLD